MSHICTGSIWKVYRKLRNTINYFIIHGVDVVTRHVIEIICSFHVNIPYLPPLWLYSRHHLRQNTPEKDNMGRWAAHALVLVEVTISLFWLRGKMSKNQHSLLNFYKYAVQSEQTCPNPWRPWWAEVRLQLGHVASPPLVGTLVYFACCLHGLIMECFFGRFNGLIISAWENNSLQTQGLCSCFHVWCRVYWNTYLASFVTHQQPVHLCAKQPLAKWTETQQKNHFSLENTIN